MVKSRRKQVTARISSTSAYQFGLLRIRVLAVALSARYSSKSLIYKDFWQSHQTVIRLVIRLLSASFGSESGTPTSLKKF